MKKINNTRTIIMLFLISILIMGCTAPITPALEPEEGESPNSTDPTTEEPLVQSARFTIQADTDLQATLATLYESIYPGETPLFVESGADLIATRSEPAWSGRPSIGKWFLQDSVLIPEIDKPDVRDFIEFAISPDGQQVLIDLGELPSVVTLADQAGNTLEIEQPVRRLISAYGPSTAIVYSINAGDRLVAASYLGARDPQGAAAMERIDSRFPNLVGDDFFSQSEFNLEHAATLEPDLVIGGARSGWAESVSQLGIQVFLMEAETPDQLKEAMLLIGQLFGPHSFVQAQAWVAYYDWVIENILLDTGHLTQEERVRVLFTGTEPLRVASGEMYQTDIIEASGGISVSGDLLGYWNDVNLEQVAIWNPDVIIVPPYGGASVAAITDSVEWQILPAVQLEKVYRMPKLVVPWDTPAPDSVLGIIWMADQLNPGLISLDCSEETVYFYQTFYNYPISGDEIAAICTIE
jgi:iron complex transport system substrate-binding protein